MSLLNTEISICNKMVYDFDSLLAPVYASKGSLQQSQSNLRSLLTSMVFSTQSDVQNEAYALIASAYSLYPGDTLEEMEAYRRMLNACTYLSSSSPVSNIMGTKIGIFDKIDDLIYGSLIPEYGAASIGNSINNILDGIGIPGGKSISYSLGRADSIIECLLATCGQGDPYYVTVADDYSTRVNDLYSDLNVVGDPLDINYGKFDYQQIYDDVGMTVSEQLNVNIALDSTTTMNTGALNAIDNSIDKVKELMKEGFF